MVKESDPSLAESSFLLAALQKGLRTDGRTVYEHRKLTLTFGDTHGAVDCTLGQTRCVACSFRRDSTDLVLFSACSLMFRPISSSRCRIDPTKAFSPSTPKSRPSPAQISNLEGKFTSSPSTTLHPSLRCAFRRGTTSRMLQKSNELKRSNIDRRTIPVA